MEYWGKHYLIDCKSCDINLISDIKNIKAFLLFLVREIEMKAYGEPLIEHFATHDPEKGGYTFCQLIETSLIDGHLVDKTGDAYISIHSCKNFETIKVDHAIKTFFNPKNIKSTIIYRSA
jgi:S-adenosylmethionine/arginine decarboxylase-like enzyme